MNYSPITIAGPCVHERGLRPDHCQRNVPSTAFGSLEHTVDLGLICWPNALLRKEGSPFWCWYRSRRHRRRSWCRFRKGLLRHSVNISGTGRATPAKLATKIANLAAEGSRARAIWVSARCKLLTRTSTFHGAVLVGLTVPRWLSTTCSQANIRSLISALALRTAPFVGLAIPCWLSTTSSQANSHYLVSALALSTAPFIGLAAPCWLSTTKS